MDLKISNSVKETEIKNYANSAIKIDCSDGINPFGCAKNLLQVLENVREEDISTYSHTDNLVTAISNYFHIDKDNIVLCGGSIQGLELIITLFKTDNAKILTFAPTFPDFANYSILCGYNHKEIVLQQDKNYECDIEELIENIDEEVNLIYIDNPNNPTGQYITKDKIIRLLEYTKNSGIGVIIDEAFLDFLPENNSCVDLTLKYDNLIIVKTFSKGFGLAGARVGYIISSKEICTYLKKIQNPYSISRITEKLAIEALRNVNFLKNNRDKLKEYKKIFLNSLPKTIKVAKTNEYTPICLLYTENKNLEQAFMEVGIKVYSGTSFKSLGINTVRLCLPKIKDWELLLELIKKINIEGD